MDSKTQQLMQLAQETGNVAIVESLKKQYSSHPYKDRCFHYLPYLMDSSFEQIYLKEVLSMKDIENYGLKQILDDVVLEDYAEFHQEQVYEDIFGDYAVIMDKFISDRVLSKITEFNQKAFLNSTDKKPYKPN